jgi:hypothetical protein
VRSRIANLLAVPLLALGLLAVPSPAAAEETSTLVHHERRVLHFSDPKATGPSTDGAAVTAETCFWDVYIFRADASGNISGRVETVCNAVMALIEEQVVLLNNGNPRPNASLRQAFPNTSRAPLPLNFAVPCLSGANQAFGSVLVVNYAGYAASDYGYSASTIFC